MDYYYFTANLRKDAKFLHYMDIYYFPHIKCYIYTFINAMILILTYRDFAHTLLTFHVQISKILVHTFTTQNEKVLRGGGYLKKKLVTF